MDSIDGFGNNFQVALKAGVNQYELNLEKPALLRVTWGENSDTPAGPFDGVNIAALFTGPEGQIYGGGGTQKTGSIDSDNQTVPAGRYVLTLLPTSSADFKQGKLEATNVTLSNQCSYPR